RPRRPAPRREEEPEPGRPAAPGRGARGARRPAASRRPRRLVRGPRRRDRRDRGRRRKRPVGADRRDHRPAAAGGRNDPRRRTRGRPLDAAAHARPRRRPHPGGPPAARPRARVLDRRERRAARLREGAGLEVGLALPGASRRAGAAADLRVRRPRRRPAHAGRRPLRRQPAEARRSARGRARPEGARRRPADARPRRRRDRVPPPAARGGARQGPRDPAHLARARRGALAVGPDPRPLRGRDRGRVRPVRLRGGARARDARRRAAGSRRVTEPVAPGTPPEPVSAAVLAFIVAGLVVAATGHDPLTAYKDIFEGAGYNWIFHPSTDTAAAAPYNLSQTLLQTTTLILTGLAVAFAFRCGMFNIGGQGQYIVGLVVANWIGISFIHLDSFLHVVLCIVLATLAGAVWAGIAGFLKATAGAHEVISTIMLNWIAIWGASYLFGDNGPLQGPNPAVPVSGDVVPGAQLPVFWGDQGFQGLHVGLFLALAALVVYWLVLNRTTVGYEVRAVGYNPDAAAYGGISVRKNFVRAMAISGAFAGLAGALDMIGYLYHFGVLDVQSNQIGFLGIAVALLGRNTAVGTGVAAFLFGGLLYGTNQGLTSGVIPTALAQNVTYLIQGLVVLFVGADVLILYVWNARKKVRRARA